MEKTTGNFQIKRKGLPNIGSPGWKKFLHNPHCGSGDAACSTDEEVIVVSSSGTATAVGKGEAFMVIQTEVGMYSLYKYIVE